MIKTISLILGNQLFNPTLIKNITEFPIFMCESDDLCTHFKYHKLKLIFFLTAMRDYHDELKLHNLDCFYHQMPKHKQQHYVETLTIFCKEHQVETIHHIEIEDMFFEQQLDKFAKSLSIERVIHKSPMFLTSKLEFEAYLTKSKKPFMKTFYEQQRRYLDILMQDNKPYKGQWSFDEDNRKKTPKKIVFPSMPQGTKSTHLAAVKSLIEYKFKDHCGQTDHCWFVTSRAEVNAWLDHFIDIKFNCFGDYEDAIDTRSDFLFHSALSPYINCGLITPNEILEKVIPLTSTVPINSLEGFIRQIIGWREFIRGIYHNFDHKQQSSNFFNHQRYLTADWYNATTGLEPLDHAINQVMRLGYTHHINRLMVIGNVMLLCQVHPKEVYRWFMECFIDSADWVMGPNVYGMSQFSDGGIFATKPYFCGANYIKKMSHFSNGKWTEHINALYWRFIIDHQEFFKSNFRMKFMVSKIKTFDSKKIESILSLSEQTISQLTTIKS